MIFIWRGYGFLVPVITIAVGAIVSVLFQLVFNTQEPWSPCAGIFAAAAALWYIGNLFNSPAKDRVMIDKLTGQEFIFKPNHSFFFIKMQYWAFLVAAVGIIFVLSILIAP